MKKFFYLLYQPYKWIFYIPFFWVSTLIFGSVAVITAFLVNDRAASYLGGVIWSRLHTFLVPVKLTVLGREHVRPGQSYVIVANHQSTFDIFILYGFLNIDFKWVMKQELRKVPGIGMGCQKVGHIFIDRSNHEAALASINEAKKKIVNGTSVIFFPEGTRSMDGRIMAFKKGAFKMALEMNLPILPVSLNGTRNILPCETLDVFPGRVEMKIHEPVSVEGLTEEDLGPLMEKVRHTMIREIEPVLAPGKKEALHV